MNFPSILINDRIDIYYRTQENNSKTRRLDDEEPGSEVDEDRAHLNGDELDGSGNEETHERAQTILDVNIGRHAIPKPSDGEVSRSNAFIFLHAWSTTDYYSFISSNSPIF